MERGGKKRSLREAGKGTSKGYFSKRLCAGMAHVGQGPQAQGPALTKRKPKRGG